MLRPLGLWETFARVPRKLQEVFWKFKSPDPVLQFDASFPDSKADRALRREMERAFRKASFTFDASEIKSGTGPATMSVRDFLGVLFGCLRTVQEVGERFMPPEMVQFSRAARPRLEAFFEKYRNASFEAMFMAIRAAAGPQPAGYAAADDEAGPGTKRKGKMVRR